MPRHVGNLPGIGSVIRIVVLGVGTVGGRLVGIVETQ